MRLADFMGISCWQFRLPTNLLYVPAGQEPRPRFRLAQATPKAPFWFAKSENPSFSDAKTAKNPVQNVIGVNGAHDLSQLVERVSNFGRREFVARRVARCQYG